jgi:hypothetical protein
MEYLILNEESLPFKVIKDSHDNLPTFFEILSEAFSNNLETIRVSENFDRGWYNIEITEGYRLREWIEIQEIEYKRKLKSLIDKTKFPQIPHEDIESRSEFELSDFYLKKQKSIKTPSLGVSYLVNQLSISFLSDEIWDNPIIEITYLKMKESTDIEENNVLVRNSARIEHWNEHFIKIEDERKNNNRRGSILWENREKEFCNLIFCGATKNQITNLSVSNATFDSLWGNLKKLNNNINKCNNDKELKDITKLDFSPESESVRNNPKLNRYRMFQLPDGKQSLFSLHIKNFPGYFRLYFLPDYNGKKIFIGYFGKHLQD